MTPSPLLDWRDRTAVVIASGPSLTDQQVGVVENDNRCMSIVTNTSYRKCLAPDVVFGVDFLWWKLNLAAVKDAYRLSGSPPKLWTQDRAAAERFGLRWTRPASRDGLGRGVIHTGGNSGYAAINLAYLFGARRILLLGFDMQAGPKGEKHWHPDHPKPLVQHQQFNEWAHKFKRLAEELRDEGARVVNCTPGSALPWFPMGKIEEELVR